MREWFLSSEIMQIDTMPNSTAGISVRAKKESWKSRKAKGGGRSLEYHISNFTEDVAKELIFHFDRDGYHQLVSKEIGVDVNVIELWDDVGSLESKILKYKKTTGNQEEHQTKGICNKLPSKDIKHIETLVYEIDTLVREANYDALKNLLCTTIEKSNLTDSVKLDFYDVETNAGTDKLVIHKDQIKDITFSHQFIANDIGVNSNNIFMMSIQGDSMSPILKNQALIMVNKVDEFFSDGIYVFQFNGRIMIKRLQFTKDGLKIVSDNSTYEPWLLTREETTSEAFKIIGTIVWSGQKM